MNKINSTLVILSLLFIFSGVTIFLSAPSVFSYVRLSDRYWSAVCDERIIYKSAAEAILAADLWNGTGARISGLLVQIGALVLSLMMLSSSTYSKLTAVTGIITHGLDLLHIILAFFAADFANAVMSVAGLGYLLWFPLIAHSLFRLIIKKNI